MKLDSSFATVSRLGPMLCWAMLIGLMISCSNAKGEKKMTIQVASLAFPWGIRSPRNIPARATMSPHRCPGRTFLKRPRNWH